LPETLSAEESTDEAIDAGRLYEEDCTPENIKAITGVIVFAASVS